MRTRKNTTTPNILPVVNKAGLTHPEHSASIKNATPCSACDLTFGGRCLACGFEPAPQMSTRELRLRALAAALLGR